MRKVAVSGRKGDQGIAVERRSAGMENTVENIAADLTREGKKHQERITFK